MRFIYPLFLFLLLLPGSTYAEVNYSPYMNLPIPIVGVDTGPDYANNINAALLAIDFHNHTPGYGQPVPVSGLNINADLPFAGNNATGLRACRYNAQTLFSSTADNDSVYVSGVDLYYRDGNGNNIQITSGGGVAGSPGTIANLTSPASASYVSLNSTFVWQSAASTPANMDMASVIIRPLAASPHGVTISAPTGLAANYSLTLPSALAGSQSLVTIDASGNFGFSTPATSSGTPGSSLVTNPNFSGNAAQENGKNIAVSLANGTTSPAIVFMGNTNTGAGFTGKGYGYNSGSTGYNSTGNYGVTFSSTFSTTPACTCSLTNGGQNAECFLSSVSTTGLTVIVAAPSTGTSANSSWDLICIGSR